MNTLPTISINFETALYQEQLDAFFNQCRRQHPIFRNSENVIYITTYPDCYELLMNEAFIRRPEHSNSAFSTDSTEENSSLESMIDHWMVFQDPPYHTKLRSALGKVFTPNNLNRSEAELSNIAAQLLESLPINQSFDFIEHFAYPFPILVIASFFNIDKIDLAYFKDCSLVISRALNAGDKSQFDAAHNAVHSLRDYFLNLYIQRQHHPGDDIFGLMIKSLQAGELSLEDIIDSSIFLIWAGHETTKLLISNTLLLLLKNPEQKAFYHSNSSSSEALIEESLRMESPIQKISRWTSKDTIIHNHHIKKNTLITGLIGAANRDSIIFDNPDKFIINRTNNKHIAFGKGIHHCLGAYLARMEGKIVFDQLRTIINNIDLIDYQWRATSAFRCLENLTIIIKK